MQWIAADLAGVRAKLTNGVLALIPEHRWSEHADGGGSSVNHLLVHLARHQDLAVATAIGGRAPLFAAHADALGVADRPGAALAEREDTTVTADLAPAALRAYVDAVFEATDALLAGLEPGALDERPAVRERLAGPGRVDPVEVGWLHEMWGSATVGWLVQWPVIGHANAHIGELISVRNRMGLSPF